MGERLTAILEYLDLDALNALDAEKNLTYEYSSQYGQQRCVNAQSQQEPQQCNDGW